MIADNRPIVIVEDSNVDYEVTALLLVEAGVRNPIFRLKTGLDAIAWIENPVAEAPLPMHILLDLNLPGLGGIEVLGCVRQSQRLFPIPVTIFSTSSNVADVNRCYRAGANGYLIKPVDFERQHQMIQDFANFWIRTAAVPDA